MCNVNDKRFNLEKPKKMPKIYFLVIENSYNMEMNMSENNYVF